MRVCFSCVAARGHIDPLLPLAGALRAAGHDVVFATAPSFEPSVEAAGFGLLPTGLEPEARMARLAPYRRELAELPPERRRPLAFTRAFAVIDAPAKAAPLLAAGRAWKPDLIVHDVADLAAPLVASVLGVPAVTHSVGPLVPVGILEEASRVIAPLWHRFGLPAPTLCGLTGSLYVDICPPSLQREQPPSARIAPLRPVSVDHERRRTRGGRTRIHVSLGTVFNDPAVMRVLLAGLARGNWDVIATMGNPDRDPAMLGPQPTHVRVERYVSPARVLPGCDLVVGHGGCGGVLAALAHGLPMLLVPQGADQFDNATRCTELQVARQLRPGQVTEAAVHEHTEAMLADERYPRRARGVAQEIAAMPAPERLVPCLEALAGQRMSSRSDGTARYLSVRGGN